MPETRSGRESEAKRSAVDLGRPVAVETIIPEENGEREGHDPLTALAEERATYRDRLPELLRDHESRFVLIKGRDVVAVFDDRTAALREGYRRFGIVPFLVRQVTASEPVVSLPDLVP